MMNDLTKNEEEKMTTEKCTIKYVNNKWHCYGPDGKDYCAYTVKAWAIMCGESHGWIPVDESPFSSKN